MVHRTAKDTILVFSAHSDDFVIGAGGTIAEYTRQGKKVIAIIFSYGEKSHPWLQETVVQNIRREETLKACKILQCSEIFFNLKEGRFLEEHTEKKIMEKLVKIMEKENPSKIFTHSPEDPHPDHRAVYALSLLLLERLTQIKPELYIYSVWNPVSFKTEFPSLYVDISASFSRKVKALAAFHSQRLHIAYPFLLLLYRAIMEGIRIRKRFAEKFFRLG